MRPDRTALEAEIELTAQESQASLGMHDVIEIEDIATTDSLFEGTKAANTDRARNDETLIIELTSEQIDAMLAGKWPQE